MHRRERDLLAHRPAGASGRACYGMSKRGRAPAVGVSGPAGNGAPRRVPRRLRVVDRPAQRRQVDAAQPAGRARSWRSCRRARRRRATASPASAIGPTPRSSSSTRPGCTPGAASWASSCCETVERAVEDVDVVCLVVDATDRSGPDDLVLAPLRAYGGTTVCALNKVDLRAAQVGAAAAARALAGARIRSGRSIPISAHRRHQLRSSPGGPAGGAARASGVLSGRRHQRPAGDVLRGRGHPRAGLPLHRTRRSPTRWRCGWRS